MERDALLAHGTSFLLQDRLMNCSDYSTAWVCRTCGSLVSLGYDEIGLGREIGIDSDEGGYALKEEHASGPGGEYCRICRSDAEDERMQRKRSGEISARLNFEREEGMKGADLDVVAVPFVFRLLVAELSAMGIKITIGLD
jgi:DNA-directed RNA polymerase I subunit RPA2